MQIKCKYIFLRPGVYCCLLPPWEMSKVDPVQCGTDRINQPDNNYTECILIER